MPALALLALTGCLTPFPASRFVDDPFDDYDGDGLTESQGDCDDAHPTIRPGAVEVCDQADNDCDGLADDTPTDPTTWYRDADGDLYGDETVATTTCTPPAGFVARGGDCDDSRSLVHPGVTETCTAFDDNCDGDLQVADGASAPTWYLDRDGDNFGDASVPSAPSCDAPAGYVYDASDCDDTRAAVRPRAVEVCDGLDNDCDDLTDDADPDATGQGAWFRDTDADGHGDPVWRTEACAAPEGYVASDADCDDTSADVSPDAAETCDSIDQDCDGLVDDGVTTTFFADLDADGFGDADGVTAEACSAPASMVEDFSDCDDADPHAFPEAPEVCDGADNDCNGYTDEPTALDAPTWFNDADGDSYGDADARRVACVAPSGAVTNALDCDDSRAAVHPGAVESCRTDTDDDCDGSTNDPGADGCRAYFADLDGDGFGGDDMVCQCEASVTHAVRLDGDCDDATSSVNPFATEDCATAADDDCSGTTNDEDAARCVYLYVDIDADGYGDDARTGLAVCACDDVVLSTAPLVIASARVEGDCDDADARISPDADELCDDVDDDCDGTVDDDALDAPTWYADADADGFGATARSTRSCDAPAGYVATGGDCEDGRNGVYPGAVETCLTVYDDDCDSSANDPGATGCTTWYLDTDGDGFGTTVSQCTCDAAGDHDSRYRTDCDDAEGRANPSATESCATTYDDDCDGSANEAGASGCVTYFYDHDGDGYGTSSQQCLCAPSGYYTATALGDCADEDPLRNVASGDCGPRGTITTSSAVGVVTGMTGGLSGNGSLLQSFTVGDYNQDGWNDLILGSTGHDNGSTPNVGALFVFLGPLASTMRADSATNADVAFTMSSGGAETGIGSLPAVMDVDGDGATEVLVNTESNGAWVLSAGAEGSGWLDESSSLIRRFNDGDTLYDKVTTGGDVDGDDNVDFFASRNRSTDEYWLEGSNPSTRVNTVTSSLNYHYRHIAVDIDQDGFDDFVGTAGYEAPVTAWAGDNFTPFTTQIGRITSTPGNLRLDGDLDEDGYPGVLILDGGASVYSSTTGTISAAGYVAVADLDDFVAGRSSSTVDIRLVGAAINDKVGNDASVGDVDGDGHPDIVVGSDGHWASVTFLKYGPFTAGTYTRTSADATFAAPLGGSTPMGVDIAELTGDSYDDMLVGSTTSTNIYLFPGGP